MIYGEDIELDNVERIERMLTQKFGSLSTSLSNNIGNIKHNLKTYLIDDTLLEKINEAMYKASNLDDIKQVEHEIRTLSQTFWD